MPVHSRATIRYATALVIAAEKTDALDPSRVEAERLSTLVRESAEFRAFLENPTIAMERKLIMAKALFGDRLSSLMSHFLDILIRKYREALLPEILESVLALLDEKEGRAVAEISSAVELNDDQRMGLTAKLEALTGKTISLDMRVDPDVGSGFVARVGEKVYDASLTAQLSRMHRQLIDADIRGASK
jgi:F-type H+-transporting ATPase subunit delta